MSKNILSGFFFVLFFSILTGNCQLNSTSGQKQVDIPVFELLSLDSTTIFKTTSLTNKKPVVILFFNTTCDHCQNEAADLVRNSESLKKIQLVMISAESLEAIRSFYDKYSLSMLHNLIIGKDFHNAGAKFYRFESFPYCAIYSREHKHIDSLERDFNTQTIFQKLKNKGEL